MNSRIGLLALTVAGFAAALAACEQGPTVERAMTAMNECAQSQRDRFLMQGVYK